VDVINKKVPTNQTENQHKNINEEWYEKKGKEMNIFCGDGGFLIVVWAWGSQGLGHIILHQMWGQGNEKYVQYTVSLLLPWERMCVG